MPKSNLKRLTTELTKLEYTIINDINRCIIKGKERTIYYKEEKIHYTKVAEEINKQILNNKYKNNKLAIFMINRLLADHFMTLNKDLKTPNKYSIKLDYGCIELYLQKKESIRKNIIFNISIFATLFITLGALITSIIFNILNLEEIEVVTTAFYNKNIFILLR
ncbi:MAG: hypothetical protein JEZ05_08845 [Tenericutes bacterium]|nr:hypothetical protein [Mycoplasmatota bacterium]